VSFSSNNVVSDSLLAVYSFDAGVQLSEETAILSSSVAREMTTLGVLVVPAGPKVVRFVPPLIVSEDEVTKAMNIFEEVISTLAQSREK
jgi:acetylornithine aminotransferase